MQNIEIGWEVDGLITAKESVKGVLEVIAKKNKADSGTFWCWDGRVSRHFQVILTCYVEATMPLLT